MLYIFLVDSGELIKFDMNLAMEKVSQLRLAIARVCDIPVIYQVLLVSGGETLNPDALVGSYSGGTDTNPIFLYSKLYLNNESPPSYNTTDYSENLTFEFKKRIEDCLTMSATYLTVNSRAQLAKELSELAQKHKKDCEQLVSDQHMQHQGWAAVVANLEDTTTVFEERAGLIGKNFSHYMDARQKYLKLLNRFKQIIEALSEIKVIPSLLNENSDTNTLNESSPPNENFSLLDWLSSFNETQDLIKSLFNIAHQCSRSLENLNETQCEKFQLEVQTALEAASKKEMKEIKGLGDRLRRLEELKCELNKIVQEQSDLAQSFLQNQTRAENVRDKSILPDLCASHKRQLQVMIKNDDTLRNIKQRIVTSKGEFSVNIFFRLKWVMYVENKYIDLEESFLLYNENAKRLRNHINVIEQLDVAPRLYVDACREVVRRRAFSQIFLCWANDLSSKLLAVHNDEVARRSKFRTQFHANILIQKLFPGLEDEPSAFATQAPKSFDTLLPKLKLDDLQRLEKSSKFSDVIIPDLNQIISFFLKTNNSENRDQEFEAKMNEALSSVGLENFELKISQNLKDNLNEETTEEQRSTPLEKSKTPPPSEIFPITTDFTLTPISTPITSSITTINTTATITTSTITTAIPSTEDGARHERGFDSETDTEDFEKVAADAQLATIEVRSPDLTAEFALQDIYLDESLPSSLTDPPPPQRQMTDAIALLRLLQENLGNTRADVERLKMLFNRIGVSSLNVISGLRRELAAMRSIIENQSSSFHAETVELVQKASEGLEERLNIYKNQLGQTKLEIAVKNEQLISLQNLLSTEVVQRREVSQILEKTRSLNKDLEEKLSASELNHQKALKDLEEKLKNEHRHEIRVLQCRYKLMSSMERSPSESSLEKIEFFESAGAPSFSGAASLPNRELDSSLIVREEKLRSEAKIRQALTRATAEKQVLFNESLRYVAEEKDKLIDDLRSKESSLKTELINKDKTINNLIETTSGHNDSIMALQERIRILELEKTKLKSHLEGALNASVAVYSEASSSIAASSIYSSRDVATSPEPSFEEDLALRDKLTSSTRVLLQQGKVETTSCKKGDLVLVIWDEVHWNYIVYQKSLSTSKIHFVQNYSFEALGLQVIAGERPKKLCVAAEVYEKERCIAKKSENRYRVPEGTKFYRVAVRPPRL